MIVVVVFVVVVSRIIGNSTWKLELAIIIIPYYY